MSDLISRKMAIGAIEEMQMPIMRSKWESDQFKFSALAEVREMISELPSAQPQRKTGKWITVPGRLGNEVKCDQCNTVFWYWLGNYRFCPSCGSKNMDERGERDA